MFLPNPPPLAILGCIVYGLSLISFFSNCLLLFSYLFVRSFPFSDWLDKNNSEKFLQDVLFGQLMFLPDFNSQWRLGIFSVCLGSVVSEQVTVPPQSGWNSRSSCEIFEGTGSSLLPFLLSCRPSFTQNFSEKSSCFSSLIGFFTTLSSFTRTKFQSSGVHRQFQYLRSVFFILIHSFRAIFQVYFILARNLPEFWVLNLLFKLNFLSCSVSEVRVNY